MSPLRRHSFWNIFIVSGEKCNGSWLNGSWLNESWLKQTFSFKAPAQWCNKTTKLQDQDHLFFQDRSGQDQDHFFQTKTAFFKDHQIINPRPQKNVSLQKKSGQLCQFFQSCRNYAGNRKKPTCYRLSSQVLLHPKLGSKSQIEIITNP